MEVPAVMCNVNDAGVCNSCVNVPASETPTTDPDIEYINENFLRIANHNEYVVKLLQEGKVTAATHLSTLLSKQNVMLLPKLDKIWMKACSIVIKYPENEDVIRKFYNGMFKLVMSTGPVSERDALITELVDSLQQKVHTPDAAVKFLTDLDIANLFGVSNTQKQ